MPLPLLTSRRPAEAAAARRRGTRAVLLLAVAVAVCCLLAYRSLPSAVWPRSPVEPASAASSREATAHRGKEECCTGVEGLELWGDAVKWGADHRVGSAAECCAACKAMCPRGAGECRCDTWVFCGDKERCKDRFGECWLKKQKDVMAPAVAAKGEHVMWTSGLIFGKGEGIVGLETNHGTLHIKLLPDCAPHSVAYFIELLGMRHCTVCRFYRAEGRGSCWDVKGDHIKEAATGPPYALLQGTLEADDVPFNGMPKEACPPVKRGSVGWVGSGPEFFVSLANHDEWRDAYTVFGSVLPEDMEVAEEMAALPTSTDVWSNVTVEVLRDPIYLKVKRNAGSSVS